MKKISLTIDGQKITARQGEKVLWTALEHGIYIPNLCAIKERPEPHAGCRLCFVEIEGRAAPVTACTEEVADGMVVRTGGEKALRLALAGFELLLASHPVDCAVCPASRSCELQKIARYLKTSLKPKRFRRLLRDLPIDASNPLFIFNPNKCVLCGRCVWVCRRKPQTSVLGFAHRGFERVVTTFGDEPIGGDRCLDCHDCIGACPTGALLFKRQVEIL